MHWDEKRALPPCRSVPSTHQADGRRARVAQSTRAWRWSRCGRRLLGGPTTWTGSRRLCAGARGAVTLFGGGSQHRLDDAHRQLGQSRSAGRARSRCGRAILLVTDGEFLEAREFYTRLFARLGCPTQSFTAPAARAAQGERARRVLGAWSARADVLERGKSALFDVSRATWRSTTKPRSISTRLRELGEWGCASRAVGVAAQPRRARPHGGGYRGQVRAAGENDQQP